MTRSVASILREITLIRSYPMEDDVKSRLVAQLEAEIKAVAALLPSQPVVPPKK